MLKHDDSADNLANNADNADAVDEITKQVAELDPPKTVQPTSLERDIWTKCTSAPTKLVNGKKPGC